MLWMLMLIQRNCSQLTFLIAVNKIILTDFVLTLCLGRPEKTNRLRHAHSWAFIYIKSMSCSCNQRWRIYDAVCSGSIVLIAIVGNDGCPDSKVHGANMGSIWGRHDPCGPLVGPMNIVIWVLAPLSMLNLHEMDRTAFSIFSWHLLSML